MLRHSALLARRSGGGARLVARRGAKTRPRPAGWQPAAAGVRRMATSRVAWLGRADAFGKRRPFVVATVAAVVKCTCCDLLIQTVVEDRPAVDLRRVAGFALFGFVSCGCVQYAVYMKLFPRLFPLSSRFADRSIREKLQHAVRRPDPRLWREIVGQVAVDQLGHSPFLYLPAFYICKLSAAGGQIEQALR